MEGVVLDPEQTDAVGLLAVVVGQDTEPDPDRVGKWRIAHRVASDRTISVVDPQARACIHVCVRWVLYCCGWCESWPERRCFYVFQIGVLAGSGVLSLWGCCGVSEWNGGAGSAGVGGGFWRSR